MRKPIPGTFAGGKSPAARLGAEVRSASDFDILSFISCSTPKSLEFS